MTLISRQPLGGSSLESGQLEVMLDRRLMQDDNKGLFQVRLNVSILSKTSLAYFFNSGCD